MAISTHLKAYTLTDIKVAPLTGETPGPLVDLPGSQKMTVTLTNDSIELRGDNALIAVVDRGAGCEVKFEAGGISLDALEVLLGLTYTESGTTPNVKRTLDIGASDPRPYFFAIGKSLGDTNVEDLHVAVWKLKLTDNFEITLADGEFMIPTCGGKAVGRDADDKMLTLIHNETAAALAVPS